MFVGEKLTNMRLLHELSRLELANDLGVTEQVIWQYENNYTTPSLEIINKLKNIFDVRARFFYTDNGLSNEINENNIAYRSSDRNSRKKTKSERVHIEYLNSFIDLMEGHLKFPVNLLVEIRDHAIEYVKISSSKQMDNVIEDLAMYTRSKIGMNENNNDDLLFLIEKCGAFVFEKSLGSLVDAYSTWSESNRPYIMLGNYKKSSVRRNFDLAHELGHLILHYRLDISELDSNEYELIENQANQFAANFLLPTNKIIEDFSFIQKVSNPKSYIDLKKKWKVSIAAIGHRAFSQGHMTYQQYRYFNILMNKYNYKVNEPLDNELTIMMPGKIRCSLRYLFENNLCTLEQILDATNFEINMLSKLFDIEQEFFEKYKDNQNRIFHFNSQVRKA